MCTLPPLVDDLIDEILLRLPPDDPACLARASLACKLWRRILTDPGFHRRYGEFHRTPPMLGCLQNTLSCGDPYSNDTCIARFVPTSTFRPAAHSPHGMYAIAACHGRVLLHTDSYTEPLSFVVWNAVTDEQWSVSPLWAVAPSYNGFNAVVLCATDGCDHLDCHGGPFAVAFVGVHRETQRTFACLYSSEAGEWGKPAWLENTATATIDNRPGVLVGNAVYFTCFLPFNRWILEYDMGRGELSVMEPPLMHRVQTASTVLTMTEDGKLGFAGVHGLSLYMWSQESGAWTQRRVIELETMLLHFGLGKESVWHHQPSLIGFAAGASVVFLITDAGRGFSVDLKSGRYQKTSFPIFHNGDPPILIPYMSFYTPRTTRK